MRLCSMLAVTTALLAMVTCASPEAPEGTDSAWIGSITTEGEVTTVVNQAGSIWGGPGRLVEDLSIGVEQGEDPYMFGYVSDIWATADRIYVVDSRVPALRVFDHQGRYLRDFGRQGDGPGEYQMPNAVAVLPDGRVLTRDGRPGQRINVYDEHGESVDTWYGDRMLGSGLDPTLTYDGDFYSQTFLDRSDDPDDRTLGMGKTGPDGVEGAPLEYPEFDFEDPLIEVSERWRSNVPLAPRVVTAMSPSGAMIAGLSSTYRFVIARPDGSTMIVEKYGGPLRASAEEREWRRRSMVRSGRNENPTFQWDGAEMPDHHPAFGAFIPDRSQRLWVIRRAAIDKVLGCTEDPLDESVESVVSCWQLSYVADVFDEQSGKFLGEVPLPETVTLQTSYIEDDAVYSSFEDEAGTIMVKRYRLVPPGKQ